jgi:glycosyltransferase involved in cell wall biosynthesis
MADADAPLVMHVTAAEYTARTVLVPQLTALADAGYRVRLATWPEGAAFASDLDAFAPVPVNFPRRLDPLRSAQACARLQRIVGDLRPDVLHLHSPAVALPFRFMHRQRSAPATRIAYTAHGFPFQWDRLHRPRDRMLELVERRLSRRTDLLLLQSREDYDEVRARGYAGRIVHLGNGVEDEWFEIDAPSKKATRLRLLYIGRVVREKGILDLLDALPGAPSAELTVVGDEIGSERDGVMAEVRARVARYGLELRVRLAGYVEGPQLRREMAAHDALVLPSYREGLPRSVIEAMAAGRPAIVSDVRGCRELVTEGQSGFVVPPGAPSELAAAIERLAHVEPADFGRLSEAARRFAEDNHRERAVVGRLVRAYEAVGVRAPVRS